MLMVRFVLQEIRRRIMVDFVNVFQITLIRRFLCHKFFRRSESLARKITLQNCGIYYSLDRERDF